MAADWQLLAAGPGAATTLARLHGQCFAQAWSADEFEALLAAPGSAAVLACVASERNLPIGFALGRSASEEVELLSLGVLPAWRGRGLGRALVERILDIATGAGGLEIFLEVAGDNDPALALYRALAFRQVGRRRNYYRRQYGSVDALLLRRRLAASVARR